METPKGMPWQIEYHVFGEGTGKRERPIKVMPDGIKLHASEEDVQIWNHVQALGREVFDLVAEKNSAALAEAQTPAPPPAPSANGVKPRANR